MIDILILAHRGTGKGRNENSLNAFSKGLSGGAHGVELDIRLTKDKIPICVHDETLKRVYDSDLVVSNLNLIDIKKNNLFNADSITTLENVFKKFADTIYYDIEIKDPKVIDVLVELVIKYNIDNLMVSSFKHFCLKEVNKKMPLSLIAPIIDFKDVKDYKKYILNIIDEYHPFSLNLDIRFFYESTDSKVQWFKSIKKDKNIKLAFWTVNSKNDFKLVAPICDFLITDKSYLFGENLKI